MQKTLKPILIILGLVVIGALAYVFLIKKDAPPTLTREAQTGVVTDASVQRTQIVADVKVDEFQKLLIEIDRIKLNTEIFNKEQYVTLIDHTQAALIRLEETRLTSPMGKQNPFKDLNSAQTSLTPPQSSVPIIKRDR